MSLVWLISLQNGWNVFPYRVNLLRKIATAAIDEFFCRFGMPLTINTDQHSRGPYSSA